MGETWAKTPMWSAFEIVSNTALKSIRLPNASAPSISAALAAAVHVGCYSFSVATRLCISMLVKLIHAELASSSVNVFQRYNMAYQAVSLAADGAMKRA